MRRIALIALLIFQAGILLAQTAELTVRCFTVRDTTPVRFYFARLESVDSTLLDSAYSNNSNQVRFTVNVTSLREKEPGLPSRLAMDQNYPNPFNPSTKIRLELPKSGSTSLKIYNLLGQEVASFAGELQAGTHDFDWTSGVAAGVYFAQFISNNNSGITKMVKVDGGGGTGSQLSLVGSTTMRSIASIDKVVEENYNKNGKSTADNGYVVRTYNLSETDPQVIDTLVQIAGLDRDTTLTVFMRKNIQTENITAYLFTTDDSSKVIDYVAELRKKSDNSLVSRENSDTNKVIFSDVEKGIGYKIDIIGNLTTKPAIVDTTYDIADTLVKLYTRRFLKPATLSDVHDVSFKEDIPPLDSILLAVNGIGYDKEGDQVPDSMLAYKVVSQSDTGLVKLEMIGNELKVARLKNRGNGSSNAVIRVTAPNGMYDEKNMTLNVLPMRNLDGKLTDDEGNPMVGYVMVYNTQGDTAIAMTDTTGKFSLSINPSVGDTLVGQIIRQGRNEGFLRTIYVPTGNDTSGLVLDAVPLLPESKYIGADTLASFAWEANFQVLPNGMNYQGLKKANLDSLKEVISSSNIVTNDTIRLDEQLYIMEIIRHNIDPFFKKPSNIYVVPQDSITKFDINAINWFKDKDGALGSIASWDDNHDGVLEGSEIRLRYIWYINGQDTIGNDRAIMQEGLSGRIAPGEVGVTSPIPMDKTVLHMATSQKTIQPADVWLIKIAENYAPKTDFYSVLRVGNLENYVKNHSLKISRMIH